jgi:heme oxygenase (biliverdin-producing, ferredoxin)
MSLKDLTHEQHRSAETRPFVKVLFKGDIDPEIYATYLYSQFPMYELLEVFAMGAGLVNDIPEILRSKAIYADFKALWPHEKFPTELPVVKKYLDHLMSIKDDPKKLMAHMYVRHMGDLSGGQMIAKRVPGPNNFYKFDCDIDDLKNRVRTKISDDMADEARVAFAFAAETFDDMMKLVETSNEQ